MKTWLYRLSTLVLILFVLGGGASLPNLDILLFHQHGKPNHTSAHIENSKGCASHAGHCGISCPASESGALGVQVVRSELDAATRAITLQALHQWPMPHDGGIGFHSRAPPTLFDYVLRG